MRRQVPTLDLAGKRFVVLEQAEYDRLRTLDRRQPAADLPPLPAADHEGNRHAAEFLRVSIARDMIRQRQAAGLTQEQLAGLAGVRQETISRLESGKQSPTVRTIDKIDRALAKAAEFPSLPEPDAEGNYPAVAYARASLARKIIRDRVAVGLNQRELAKLAGIRVETLCRIETGKHTPSVPTIDKIERALKTAPRQAAPRQAAPRQAAPRQAAQRQAAPQRPTAASKGKRRR